MNVINVSKIPVWSGVVGKIFLTTGLLQLGLLQILIGTAGAAAIGAVISSHRE